MGSHPDLAALVQDERMGIVEPAPGGPDPLLPDFGRVGNLGCPGRPTELHEAPIGSVADVQVELVHRTANARGRARRGCWAHALRAGAR